MELVSNVPLSWQHLEDCNRKIFENLDKFLNFWYLTLEYDSAVAIISFNNLRIQYSSKYKRLRIYLLLWHIYGNVMLNHKHTINVSSTRTIVMIFCGSRHFSRGRYLIIWWEKNSSKVIKFIETFILKKKYCLKFEVWFKYVVFFLNCNPSLKVSAYVNERKVQERMFQIRRHPRAKIQKQHIGTYTLFFFIFVSTILYGITLYVYENLFLIC